MYNLRWNNEINFIIIKSETDRQMFEKTADQLDAWKAEMHIYEKNKRTKKPFGKNLQKIQHVTYEQMKEKEIRFNPVLQNYRVQRDQLAHNNKDEMMRARSLMNHIMQHQKYERNYDIINLHGGQTNTEPQSPPKKLGPIRNAYNVINNQKLPDFHFKNREMRLPVQRQKNLIANNQKQYNIITNVYNQNHEERSKVQEANQKSHIIDKYWRTHDYDPVFGKFYDEDRERQFQQERKQNQKEHGKDCDKNLPPSYVYREAYIPDPSKPLPSSLQTLDQRRMNAKKRYRLKYVIEDEYNHRNFEDEEKKEQVITNKVHPGRVLEEKEKQFNIITMKNYPVTRAEELYRKPLTKSPWEPYSYSSVANESKQPLIKTGGFK